MNNRADIPTLMSRCERIETMELAVIRQARVRVWLADGEVVEGQALNLETRHGIDWLTVDKRRIDASLVTTLLTL